MITSIIYNSNLLDGLFNSEDVDFLRFNNSKQDEIEAEIELSDLKKNEILKYMQTLETDTKSASNFDEVSFNNSFEIASSASKSINSAIKNLNTLFNGFNDLEKDVLELAVKKETTKGEDINLALSKINVKIADFKEAKNKIEKENKEYYSNIDKFFTALESGNLLKLKKTEPKLESKVDTTYVSKSEEESHMKVFNVYDVDFKDNLELKISEKDKKVYLPYTKQDLQDFMNDYPNEYPSAKSVIDHEFTEKISMYNNHPVLARFREGYYLSKYKEMNSTMNSLKFAKSIMFRRDLNPTIVAAVKSREQLEDYLECLNANRLEDFKHFKITFEVNPIKGL